MTKIIIILAIEFAVLVSFAVLIYRIVKKDMKKYERQSIHRRDLPRI